MDKDTSSGGGGGGIPRVIEIDLSKLTIQELSHQKQQLDQDISMLHDSVQALKMAQAKFNESKKSIEKAQKYTVGQPLLVPLTSSMYVDGKFGETDSFVINVGTGYYLKKDAEGAKEYFKRRLNYVGGQIEKIQAIGAERSHIKEAILGAMQTKIQAITQQSQGNQPPE